MSNTVTEQNSTPDYVMYLWDAPLTAVCVVDSRPHLPNARIAQLVLLATQKSDKPLRTGGGGGGRGADWSWLQVNF